MDKNKKKPITAEEEHRQEVDEVTDMITTEDVVEQAIYMANAPDCCADEHAENMLGMLGVNIIEPEIYHDEDECPKRTAVCNASFQRKGSSIDEAPGITDDGTPCVVTDKIVLPQGMFEKFAQNLLDDYDFIAEHAERYTFGSDEAKCLLVLGEGHNDGILVVTEGFHYARYTSHIPNASEVFDLESIQELGDIASTDNISRLADYAVSEGTQHSEDGSWETSYTELFYHFGVEIEAGDELCEKLAKALRERPEVESVDITEDGLDVTYNPDYCESLQEQGITQTM